MVTGSTLTPHFSARTTEETIFMHSESTVYSLTIESNADFTSKFQVYFLVEQHHASLRADEHIHAKG